MPKKKDSTEWPLAFEPEDDHPLYIISVAAELVQMHPQTLRFYERRGLVIPKRQGKNRLYSRRDVQKLIYIQQLTQELGINLAGVEMISRLQQELEALKQNLQHQALQMQEMIEKVEKS